MGSRCSILAAAMCALSTSVSLAGESNPPVARDRATVPTATRPAVHKKLREAKREIRIAVIPTDVRQKRYLAFGDEPERSQVES